MTTPLKKTDSQEVVSYWSKIANERINSQLSHYLPSTNTQPQDFNSALQYVMGLSGKRVRPSLVYMTGQMAGASLEACDQPALAIELIHTYSLIHDDLPAMDDDDLRRGQPSCHKAYDEATAILVGDALQTLAFEVLSTSNEHLSCQQQIQMVQVLAQASGLNGMCKGQALDIQGSGQTIDLEALKLMHRCKTGALIKASVLLGALSSQNLSHKALDILADFADHIGLAFQVQDDILDITSDTKILGKPQGSDLALGKATYPALLGLDESKEYARELCEQAKGLLNRLDFDVKPLCNLADYVVNRVA